MERILGIDPGSRITGFGIIEFQRRQAVYVGSGCIRMQSKSMPSRLAEIYTGINQIIEQYEPRGEKNLGDWGGGRRETSLAYLFKGLAIENETSIMPHQSDY
jgi:hypothetical protein